MRAAPVPTRRVRRAVLASTIGNVIESYDFIVYALLATLVFPQVFFPASDTLTGVLLSFATYFVAFAARPLGAVVFGHIGDRKGRRYALLATVALMGTSTVGIGLVPDYAQIGASGAVVLVLLRICQGLALGGEWTGATLLAMESGPASRAGLLTGFPQAANLIGMAAANAVLYGLQGLLGPEAFLGGGWRIAFLLSAVLLGFGLWLRLGVQETATFTELASSGRLSRRPLRDLFRHQTPAVLLGVLLKCGDMVAYFVFTVFLLGYGPRLGYDGSFLLLAVATGALTLGLATPAVAWLGDHVGHVRLIVVGAVLAAVVATVYFPVLESRSEAAVVVLVIVSLFAYTLMFSVQGAVFGRMFDPAWRYTGGSVVINFAGVVAAGPAPFVAAALLARFGTVGVTTYLVAACALTVVAAMAIGTRPPRPPEAALPLAAAGGSPTR